MLLLICIIASFATTTLLFLLVASKNRSRPFYDGRNPLPPAPWLHLPLVGSLSLYPPTVASLSAALRRLRDAHGPVVSLWVGGTPAVFIARHDIAHRALVHMGAGATLAHRPASWCEGFHSQCLHSTTHGPHWGLLRRNLSAHLAAAHHVAAMLRSSVDKAIGALDYERSDGGGGEVVAAPVETLRRAVFGFYAALCLGEGADEDELRRLRDALDEIVAAVVELGALHLVPPLVQVVYYLFPWRMWKLLGASRRHHALVVGLISARRRRRQEEARCYVDTLLDLGLGEDEMVSLCWEFMSASVESTATALQWIMARLVLHQDVQEKLWNDIVARRNIDNGDPKAAGRRPYAEAVVLEALRRHPPAHYLAAHTADRDVSLEGYAIPRGAVVNICVAAIGCDPASWANPDAFVPERFLDGGEAAGTGIVNSVTGGGGGGGPEAMKMMPFGAGRRVCPGAGTAVTVLRSFVEGLVGWFEWKLVTGAAEDGEAFVDLTENPGVITGMKTPLRARLVVGQQLV